MVYGWLEKKSVRGALKELITATTAAAAAIFVAVQLIVFHTGNAEFPHLLVFADGGLWKPAPTDKQSPEGKSQKSYSK